VAICDYSVYAGGMLLGSGRVDRGEREYTTAIEHRDFDDWWRVRAPLTAELQNIAVNDTPALISGGWNDYISSGNVQAYKELSDADGESKLIMGAGAHGAVDDLHPFDFESYQVRSEEHTSELQSRFELVCRLLIDKKK